MGKAGGALGKLTMPLRQGIAGIGAAATIQGSIFQQGLSGLLGKAGGVVSGIANSGAGKAVGSIFSGAGLLGSIYGPIAGGLGSLLSGALPIVGVISGIIAVVSILTDKFGGLDKIIQRVFGDTGLEKFTVFKDALLGLFEDGGVAKALQPLQESITNLFGEDAGAAFGGITTILQSVMGVIGQLVTFSQTTVRPYHRKPIRLYPQNGGAGHSANHHSGGSIHRIHHQRRGFRGHDGGADHRRGNSVPYADHSDGDHGAAAHWSGSGSGGAGRHRCLCRGASAARSTGSRPSLRA